MTVLLIAIDRARLLADVRCATDSNFRTGSGETGNTFTEDHRPVLAEDSFAPG